MILYLVNWFLLLLASAIFCNAIFLVTRGRYEYKPDGTREREGALLRAWWFYWFKEKPQKKVYWYQGDSMQAVFDQVRGIVPAGIQMTLNRDFTKPTVYSDHFTDMRVNSTFGTTIEFFSWLPQLRNALDVKFKIDSIDKGVVTVMVYKEEPDYVHSWYLRTMMARCITCFASFYGLITFLAINLMFSKEILVNSLYGFYGDIPPYIYLPVTLLAYCVSLAYVNTLAYNINK